MSKDGLKLKSDDIAGVYLHAWFWCFMPHFWGSSLKSSLFPFSLQSLNFNRLLRASGFSGMTTDCKHSRKSFQILSAVISPGTNNSSLQLFSKVHPTYWTDTACYFLTSPCASVRVPSFWERLHLYLLNVWKGNGQFQQFEVRQRKSLRKQNLAFQGEGARFNQRKGNRSHFDIKEFWLKGSNKASRPGEF